MRYLIDGYNLLHALGVVNAQTSPTGMEYARRRLLDLLHDAHGSAAHDVTVVFDAQRLPRGVKAEQEYRGIQVRFAMGYPEADDLLEELIRTCDAPHNLSVVSDDHRVQQAARRRGCTVLPCGDYMDWLGRTGRSARQNAADGPDKPDAPTEEETLQWQRTFADLDNDSGMRELFEIPWSEEPKGR